MIPCPLCGHDNIEGVDTCDQCGQPLDDLHLPDPKNAVERGLLGDTAAKIEHSPPIVVKGTAQVGDVLKLLVENAIGCVFIVDDEESIVGVFSERDALLKLNTQFSELLDRPISEFMTKNPESMSESTRIAFGIHQMDIGGFRHLPILDDEGRAKGVISVRDILRYLTDTITAQES